MSQDAAQQLPKVGTRVRTVAYRTGIYTSPVRFGRITLVFPGYSRYCLKPWFVVKWDNGYSDRYFLSALGDTLEIVEGVA